MCASRLFVCREAMFRTSGSSPKAELKPIFHFSSPSSRASMRVGVFEVICTAEVAAVCSDPVSLLGVSEITRRLTAAAV
jgi:hypothetical protein